MIPARHPSSPSQTLSAEATRERKVALTKLVVLLAGEDPSGGLLGPQAAGFRKAAVSDPMGTLAATVVSAAAVLYAAEKGENPKVRSFHDALVFVSTSFSVGYSDIFAKTKLGKLVASFVMTVGPSLSARALDAPEPLEGAQKPANVADLLASQRALTESVQALVHTLAARQGETGTRSRAERDGSTEGPRRANALTRSAISDEDDEIGEVVAARNHHRCAGARDERASVVGREGCTHLARTPSEELPMHQRPSVAARTVHAVRREAQRADAARQFWTDHERKVRGASPLPACPNRETEGWLGGHGHRGPLGELARGFEEPAGHLVDAAYSSRVCDEMRRDHQALSRQRWRYPARESVGGDQSCVFCIQGFGITWLDRRGEGERRRPCPEPSMRRRTRGAQATRRWDRWPRAHVGGSTSDHVGDDECMDGTGIRGAEDASALDARQVPPNEVHVFDRRAAREKRAHDLPLSLEGDSRSGPRDEGRCTARNERENRMRGARNEGQDPACSTHAAPIRQGMRSRPRLQPWPRGRSSCSFRANDSRGANA